jgi:transposase-like protein
MTITATSPSTFHEFGELFPDDDACIDHLEVWRWPRGFRCPRCRSGDATRLSTRVLWECQDCGKQTSITAGTALQHTKVPLRTWFYAFWLVAIRKKGISALQFQRDTGLGNYGTALYLLHKVRRVVTEREDELLEGTVELDHAIMPGKGMQPGKRLGVGGAFVLAAVERVSYTDKRGRARTRAGHARAAVLPVAAGDTSVDFVESVVKMGSLVVTDGGAEFEPLVHAGVDHDSHDQKGVAVISEAHLSKVHIFISNLKTWIRGVFHGVSRKYLPNYLDEFVYRFNRRDVGPDLFGHLVLRAMRSPWTGKDAIIGGG